MCCSSRKEIDVSIGLYICEELIALNIRAVYENHLLVFLFLSSLACFSSKIFK